MQAPTWWKIGVWIALFLLLQAILASLRGTALEQLLIHDLTVVPATALANRLDPALCAHADGTAMVAPAARINVVAGCDGSEAVLLIIVAVLSVWRGWKNAAVGLAMGLAIVYVANLLRLVALLLAAVYDRELFGLLHSLIAPVFVVAAAIGAFALWLTWCRPRGTP